MICPDWNDDAPGSLPIIIANISALWPEVEAEARSRPAPSIARALAWHRRIYDGVPVPEQQYVGQVRDRDPAFPCLIDYEIAVGTARGVPARDVPDDLAAFERAVRAATSTLDVAIPVDEVPAGTATMRAVLRLSAYAHGEWVRIHMFANGTGRTARLWANWLAVRYGLPPFVRIRPRPDDLFYAGAVAMSMRGDHRATEAIFLTMLEDALREAIGQT